MKDKVIKFNHAVLELTTRPYKDVTQEEIDYIKSLWFSVPDEFLSIYGRDVQNDSDSLWQYEQKWKENQH